MYIWFTWLQVIYMGVCVYTPAFALNAGKKNTFFSDSWDLNGRDFMCDCVCVFSQLLGLNCGEQCWPLGSCARCTQRWWVITTQPDVLTFQCSRFIICHHHQCSFRTRSVRFIHSCVELVYKVVTVDSSGETLSLKKNKSLQNTIRFHLILSKMQCYVLI